MNGVLMRLRFAAKTTNRLRELSFLLRFALQSPAEFARAWREAFALVLGNELSYSSPIPTLSEGILRQLYAVGIKLPALGQFTDGTQSVEGLRCLVTLCKLCDARNVFEFGTFTGVTAFTLAANIPELVVETLDLPVGVMPALGLEKSDTHLIPSHYRRRVFEGCREAERIIQHEGDSAEFNVSSLGRKFDLVYVDGAHSYEYVANDSRAAFDIVAKNGAIIWDDYQRAWPGVVRYLDERTDLALYRVPGTRLVVWLSEQAKFILTSLHQSTGD